MSMSPIIATLISVLAVSAISLVGVFLVYIQTHRLKKLLFILVSFAVGTLLGDVFFHLVPELYSAEGGGAASPLAVSGFLLGGICLFFVLEHVLHWHHYHHGMEESHAAHPSAYVNIAADALHNFVDGLIIGASFLVSMPVGIATTLAVIFHEIPQELGDFGILVNAGFTRAKALFFNFFSATFAIIGGVIAILIGSAFEEFAPALIAITAGGFTYLALTDLMPKLHEDIKPRRSILQFIAALCGIGIMFALTSLE
ncbi:hypothetical protein A2755_03700 [Candidatus Wolfebacteria bacterium RIFCSPHIGHO2_01_FULL_48_22]|uniref:ZIP family metal transporter n=2 Tax=Candidatus Wolfeibacteriota TaxID=1752735 RepID=A0A1F8DNT1_9BACT|nr:MAG: hypothetical protein A2755_03700 [Candidatus Wolfebacteria bacterium RIFCSPHIGHO2_01_FULL_48_22]OGM93446.1 MAG: hypothetical protein A2935_01050 [Candidatus Wolfebacteria bacterium RIFCSPLOWO2_01_FULL_47_17b]